MTIMSSSFFRDISIVRGNLTCVSSGKLGIGERMKQARGSRKAEALAAAAGMSESQWSHYERGRTTELRTRNVQRIAQALGVTPAWLRGEEEGGAGAAPPLNISESGPVYAGGAASADDVYALPLVAMDAGAGRPALRLIPLEQRPYYFRVDWLKSKGWRKDDPDRFGVYRLGTDVIARSMEPTILPESVLLVDRKPSRKHIRPRSIWVVSIQGGLVVKRVTAYGQVLVLESDNREPDEEFAPIYIPADIEQRERLLEGLVIWYATEVA